MTLILLVPFKGECRLAEKSLHPRIVSGGFRWSIQVKMLACLPLSGNHLCREGTTDVTRTVHLGQPGDFEKVSAAFSSVLLESHRTHLRSGMFHSCSQRISLVIVLSVSSAHHWRSVGFVRSPCSLGCWTRLPAWNGTRRRLLSQCS